MNGFGGWFVWVCSVRYQKVVADIRGHLVTTEAQLIWRAVGTVFIWRVTRRFTNDVRAACDRIGCRGIILHRRVNATG